MGSHELSYKYLNHCSVVVGDVYFMAVAGCLYVCLSSVTVVLVLDGVVSGHTLMPKIQKSLRRMRG